METGIDVVDELLDKWATWMGGEEPIAVGYPSKAAGGFIASWIKDDDELAEAADQRELEAINASIDSLSIQHRQIIYSTHGIGYNVWRFQDPIGLYEVAKAEFKKIHFQRKKSSCM